MTPKRLTNETGENPCLISSFWHFIGRAIRHKADYASILLVDHRYGRQNIYGQLPPWIRRQLEINERFGPIMAKLTKFFRTKQ